MAGVLDAINAAGAPEQAPAGAPSVLGALAAAGPDHPQQAPAGPPPEAGERFQMGLGDATFGLGRLAQHAIPDVALNAIRRTIGFDEVSTKQFDDIVANRENDYQQARAAAGQTGIDWWRIGGNFANPMNYLGGGATAAASVPGRIAMGAGVGGVMGAIQASAESHVPGSYWWDVSRGTGYGALLGAGASTAVEGLSAGLRWGLDKARGLLGPSAAGGASAQAADAVTKQALQGAGVNPGSIDLNLLSGMRQDVQSALESGADISPTAIVNRAKAEALPVPINLTRAQATGDAALWNTERNLQGIVGVGEPLQDRVVQQNAAVLSNLDALGARGAPDTVSTGVDMAGKIQSAWDALQARKTQLYDAVRNSQGQSAAMDGVAAGSQIGQRLDTPEMSYAYLHLPAGIQKTVESLTTGDFPLSVAQMQQLDKAWGDMARGADGSTAFAINQARKILADAPIETDLGEQAAAAYKLAKAAHAQQMSLVDAKLPNGMPNPQFQPLVKSVVVDGTAPEKLFQTNFMQAQASTAQKNMQFMQTLDPNAPQQIGQTLMGEIKRQALKNAGDERGTVSEAVMRDWNGDPFKRAKMDALLPKPLVDTFRNLADTVTTMKLTPTAAQPNTSGTAAALVNHVKAMVSNSALGQVSARLPIVKSIVEGLQNAGERTSVASALNPGVTVKSLLSATPRQAQVNATISRMLAPAAAGAAVQTQQRGNQ